MLLAAARRGRISMRELRDLVPDLRLLPETIGHQTDAIAWSATLGIAEEHRLTIYSGVVY